MTPATSNEPGPTRRNSAKKESGTAIASFIVKCIHLATKSETMPRLSQL
jgi:hypothetical protein